jgi:magnesium-transporting ATPase (P-type)
MTLIAIFALEDPIRAGVLDAVKTCGMAGITVRMITGDAVGTATAVATRTGILTYGGIVMEGKVFRSLEEAQMLKILPRLQVIARASPNDKRILVEMLRAQGEVVAVTGDGTNDGPAMRVADVSFSMGLSGTPAARKASSIILLEDDFNSIVSAIRWGRGVRINLQKFLQFQLTVNLAAILSCFLFAFQNKPGLSPIQLLWLNLIMDTLAALSFATDTPNPSVLQTCMTKDDPLITGEMGWMISLQSSLMLIILYLIPSLVESSSKETLATICFNTFILLHLFNEINCCAPGISSSFNSRPRFGVKNNQSNIRDDFESNSKLREVISNEMGIENSNDECSQSRNTLTDQTSDNAMNFTRDNPRANKYYEYIQRPIRSMVVPFKNISAMFSCIWIGTLLTQVLIISYGGAVFSTIRLGIYNWLLCICLGFCSVVLASLLRIIWTLFVLEKPSVRQRAQMALQDKIRWKGAIQAVQRTLVLESALKLPRQDLSDGL